jgi:diguanylate cyclase (GGDEF)-like protein
MTDGYRSPKDAGPRPAPIALGRGSGVYPARDNYSDPLDALRTRSLAPASVERPKAEAPAVDVASLGALGIAVIVTDVEGAVSEMNGIAEALTEWSSADAVGKHLDVVFDLGAGQDEILGPLSLGPSVYHGATERPDAQPFILTRHGRRRAISYSLDRKVHGGQVLLAQDVTEARLNALRLLHLSSHDPLTGLLNRQRFIRELEHALARRGADESGVVLYLDLDRFRLVNDASGLEAGDNLLDWIGAVLREAAGKSGLVARLAGNEFGVLLSETSVAQTVSLAEGLMARMRQFRFAWRNDTFAIKSSVGIVAISAIFDSATSLLRAAENACARAKQHGGSKLHVFAEEDHEKERHAALSWVARIKDNLNADRVKLYAQPIVALDPMAPHAGKAFEVLFRMLDPDGNARGPQDVVRTAEHYGLMDAVDRWVIEHTLTHLAQNPSLMEGLDHCSINLSATSLRKETLFDHVRRVVDTTAVSPSKICFEITETAAVENLAEVRSLIQELGALGFRFSLDDFGSGMASYAYLRDLPVNYIKIDKSFVKDVERSELDAAIIESIHQIGSLLGARTIAEGVESAGVAEKVASLGVDFAQGYWFAPPKPL